MVRNQENWRRSISISMSRSERALAEQVAEAHARRISDLMRTLVREEAKRLDIPISREVRHDASRRATE